MTQRGTAAWRSKPAPPFRRNNRTNSRITGLLALSVFLLVTWRTSRIEPLSSFALDQITFDKNFGTPKLDKSTADQLHVKVVRFQWKESPVNFIHVGSQKGTPVNYRVTLRHPQPYTINNGLHWNDLIFMNQLSSFLRP